MERRLKLVRSDEEVVIISVQRYYPLTEVPVMNLNTGELAPPKLIVSYYKRHSYWDLWDEEIADRRLQSVG